MSAALTYTSAAALPNSMVLVSAPAGTQYAGQAATTPFAVQILGPDGKSPVAGQTVAFTATAGSASFGPCTAAACSLTTDANGMASFSVTPTAAGAVTLLASDGALQQSASFTALAQAGTIQIWASPSGNQPVGLDAGVIALTDHAANGSPLAGRPITFSAIAGTANFSGCAASICTVTSDSNGNALIHVTPASTGLITIQAADGAVTSSFSFTSISNTDIMQVATMPAPSVYTGSDSGAFGVNLFRADGVTPDLWQQVTFTAPAGVALYPCISNVCTVSTAWSGLAQVGIYAALAGTYTIQAAFGSVSQSASFTVAPDFMVLKIVSAPSGNVPVGATASTPFSAQLLLNGVTPVAGRVMVLAAPPGEALLNYCGKYSCWFFTDANGMVSTSVTPTAPGAITLNAVYSTLSQFATFNATGPAEAMTVIQQPGPAGVFVGDTVNLALQITAPGGGPLVNDFVSFTLLSGGAGFDWYQSTVNRGTDGNGIVSQVAYAGSPGTVTILVQDAVTSQTITFPVKAHPDSMVLLSQPASGGYAGTAAPAPFSVQVFEYDGVTPAANRAVTVSVTNGSASLTGCGGSSTCSLVTDSNGIIASVVTPLATGLITLSAAENGAQQTASFTVLGRPSADLFKIATHPASNLYAGATSVSPFSVLVTLDDGVTPVAGIPVAFSTSGAGAIQFTACAASTCTLSTDANGIASTAVTGVTAGELTLSATATLPTGAATLTVPLQVVENQLSIAGLNPSTYIIENASLILSLSASLVEDAAPDANQTVSWTSTSGFFILASSTTTDSSGTTSNQALLGPLLAGASATAAACAQAAGTPSVCAAFTGTAVSASALQLSLLSGAAQSVSAPAVLSPVVALVQDSAGHPVVSAPVSVYQTVTALDAACPTRGRCPAAPILASQATVATSALDGTVTFAPLTLPGVATQTEIALSAGTSAFATTTLTSQP